MLSAISRTGMLSSTIGHIVEDPFMNNEEASSDNDETESEGTIA